MKNLDIIIFSFIVVCSFITFFISTFRAFENLEKKNDYLSQKKGIITRFLAYMENLVAE
jgi:hypothetical protein